MNTQTFTKFLDEIMDAGPICPECHSHEMEYTVCTETYFSVDLDGPGEYDIEVWACPGCDYSEPFIK